MGNKELRERERERERGGGYEIFRPVAECTTYGKAIPLQVLTGPEGSRRLRLPDFMTIGT
jgi:hypothetical protein